ncbi:hypothetical protein L7F22_029977 [Adiantum nelumboides]|nr:hypothetical protein [Adiantum nelumboides]
MAICKHFCLPARDCGCSSHQQGLLATLSPRKSHSGIRPFSRHRSFFKSQSLTVEREESGFVLERSAAAERSLKKSSPSTSSTEDTPILVSEDDDEEDPSDDDELGTVEDAIEDIVELDELVSEDDDEDDYDGSEALVSDTSDRKADICKRVQDLCLRVQWAKDDKISARDLCALYDFRIDKFQVVCIFLVQ